MGISGPSVSMFSSHASLTSCSTLEMEQDAQSSREERPLLDEEVSGDGVNREQQVSACSQQVAGSHWWPCFIST